MGSKLIEKKDIKDERKCPICKISIPYISYLNHNKKKFDLEYLKKLWVNDNIYILCCNCSEILDNIESYEDYFEEDLGLIEVKDIICDLTPSWNNIEYILNCLREFKLIDV
jgi:hypothetical protein